MDAKITLKVATPAGVYEGTFEENTKVGDVIAVIVRAQRLAEADAYELALDGQPFAPDQELASIPLYENAVLDLIATGSGV